MEAPASWRSLFAAITLSTRHCLHFPVDGHGTPPVQLTRPHSRVSHRVAPFRIDSRVTAGSFPCASSRPRSQRAPHCSSRLPSSTTRLPRRAWLRGALNSAPGLAPFVDLRRKRPTSRRHCSPAAVDCPPIAGSPGPAGARTRERERSPADGKLNAREPGRLRGRVRRRGARSHAAAHASCAVAALQATHGARYGGEAHGAQMIPTGTRLPTRSAPPRPRSLHGRRQRSGESQSRIKVLILTTPPSPAGPAQCVRELLLLRTRSLRATH